MQIASTASGGGALKVVSYDFSSITRVAFAGSLGPYSIYTGTEPALELLAADDVASSSYVLNSGTDVSVEITAIDAGVESVKIDATVLSNVGDSAPLGTESPTFDHIHPEWTLQLQLPEGAFGESSVSFKLKSLTGPYTESPVYTIKISNGPLAHMDYDPDAYDSAAVACQKKVGSQVSTFIGKKLNYLRACLDKLQVYTARNELTSPPNNLDAALVAAEKVCANPNSNKPDKATMLGKIAAARDKAFAAIQAKCSDILSDDDIDQQLGLAGCRVEELAAGAYGGASEGLELFSARASQGGSPLNTYFPCLVPTASE